MTTLFEGVAMSFAVGRDRVVIVADSLVSVPLAGGASTVLAAPSEPQGPFVMGSTAYYQEWNPPGGVVAGGGGMPLMAVPTGGGALGVFLPALPAFTVSPGRTDGASYYFTPVRGVGNAGGLSKLTPPSTTVGALTTERFLAFSIAPYGEYVYFIGTDTALTSSFIGRVPKRGGAAEHLVPDIGVPVRTLVVDDSGLYWVQPLGRWADGIHRGAPYAVLHAGLDGSSPQQLLAGRTELDGSRWWSALLHHVERGGQHRRDGRSHHHRCRAPERSSDGHHRWRQPRVDGRIPRGRRCGRTETVGRRWLDAGARRVSVGTSRRLQRRGGLPDRRGGRGRSSAHSHRDGVRSEVSVQEQRAEMMRPK